MLQIRENLIKFDNCEFIETDVTHARLIHDCIKRLNIISGWSFDGL